MQQELYAFWRYNLFPYYLGGEVVEILEHGKVMVKNFQVPVKAVVVLPRQQGIEMNEKLNEITDSYYTESRELKDKYNITVNELFGNI